MKVDFDYLQKTQIADIQMAINAMKNMKYRMQEIAGYVQNMDKSFDKEITELNRLKEQVEATKLNQKKHIL